MPDVIVTGLPRSGSAMVSALIDYLPNAVSFNEPAWQMALAQKQLDTLPYCKWLTGDFVWTRRTMLNLEPVSDYRTTDGRPLFDGLYDPRQKMKESSENQGPEAVKEPDVVFFTKPGLTDDFILAMRHHTLFTSLLPTLVKFKHFKIIAVIRHPLDVLDSWRRMKQPFIGRGNPHGIARFWPEALAIAESSAEEVDRFVQLYDAYIQRYHEVREHIHIIKYEDVANDPAMVGRLFGLDSPSAAAHLIEKNPRVMITAEAALLKERFHKYGVFTKLYYTDI